MFSLPARAARPDRPSQTRSRTPVFTRAILSRFAVLTLGLWACSAHPLHAAPDLAPIDGQTLFYGKSLVVPLATDSATGPVRYTVKSDQRGTIARVRTGNAWLKISLSYPGDGGSAQPFSGDMLFQLFRDMTPATAGYIGGFAQEGFYDGLTFHRITPDTGLPSDAIAQGGDPNGDGTGGPGFRFENELRMPLMFAGKGQLAMANSGIPTGGADAYLATNGSQFFITSAPIRFLDFAHTIFGQLVRGEEVLENLLAVPTTNGTPTAAVTMTDVELVGNETDAVLFLSVSGKQSKPATITVTAEDATGAKDVETFLATAMIDTINSPPIIDNPPNITRPEGSRAIYRITGKDLEFDLGIPGAVFVQNPTMATGDLDGDTLTVTPAGADPDGPSVLGLSYRQVPPVLRGQPNDRARIHIGLGESAFLGFEQELKAEPGAPFSGVVAQFRDFDPTAGPLGEYTATVNWGDSSPVESTADMMPAVSVAQSPQPRSKLFDVSGAHTYANPGIYVVETVVTGLNGARAVIRNRVNVTAGPLCASGRRVTAPGGRVANRLLASFTDSAPGLARDYSARVDWGDGMRSDARVVKARDGFNVFGTHRYTDSQRFAAVVRIEKTGSADEAVAWVDVDSSGLRGEHFPPFAQAKVTGFLDVARTSPLAFDVELVNGGNKTAKAGTLEFFLSDDQVFDEGTDPQVTVDDTAGRPRETVWYGPQLRAGESVDGTVPEAFVPAWNAPPGKSFNGRYLVMRVNQTDPLGDLMPFTRVAVSPKITVFESGNPTPVFTGTGPTNQDPFVVTVDFGEPVIGFDLADVSVANGADTALNDLGSGMFEITIDPTNEGNVTISIAAQAATDATGMLFSNAGQAVVRFDTTGPTPVITGPAATASDPFDVTVSFGEGAAGFEAGDLVVGNGAVVSVTPSGVSANGIYTVRIDPAADGAVTVDIAAAVATDTAGNPNNAAIQFSTTFTAP